MSLLPFNSIQEAKNMRTGINVEGTIIKKESSRLVTTRFAKTVRVCAAYLGNDLGDQIKLTIWGDDTQRIKTGTKIRIENGYTTHYHYMEDPSLSAGKYGKLKILKNANNEKPKILRKQIINESSQFDSDNWIIDDVKNYSYLATDPKEHDKKVNDYKF